MKIIGITVGTTIPKPNFDQTDPSKGDYIKGDRSFIHSVKTINGVSPDEHGNVVVESDATLTQSGQAADAKATGDAITNLNTLIGDTSVADQIAIAIGELDNIIAVDENNDGNVVLKRYKADGAEAAITDAEIDAICGTNVLIVNEETEF